MTQLRKLDWLDPALIAADYAVSAVGHEHAETLLAALRAGWLTKAEAEALEPFAHGVAQILGVSLPVHRGVR